MTPAEELRSAAARLRDDRNCDNQDLHSESSELLAMVAVLLRAREPLAAWLERAAKHYEGAVTAATQVWGDVEHPRAVEFIDTGIGLSGAFPVAAAVNGPQRPGPVQGGPIVDHRDPVQMVDSLLREDRS